MADPGLTPCIQYGPLILSGEILSAESRVTHKHCRVWMWPLKQANEYKTARTKQIPFTREDSLPWEALAYFPVADTRLNLYLSSSVHTLIHPLTYYRAYQLENIAVFSYFFSFFLFNIRTLHYCNYCHYYESAL